MPTDRMLILLLSAVALLLAPAQAAENGALRNISKRVCVSSGFPNTRKQMKAEAIGRVILLFSSVWKLDETRSTRF